MKACNRVRRSDDGYETIFQWPLVSAWKAIKPWCFWMLGVRPQSLMNAHLAVATSSCRLINEVKAERILDANKGMRFSVQNAFTVGAGMAALPPLLAMMLDMNRWCSNWEVRLFPVFVGLLFYLYQTIKIVANYQVVKETVLVDELHALADDQEHLCEFKWYEVGIDDFNQWLRYRFTAVVLNLYLIIPAALIGWALVVAQAPNLVKVIVVGALILLRVMYASAFSLFVNVVHMEGLTPFGGLTPRSLLKALKRRYDANLLGEIRRIDFLKSTILAIAGPLGVAMSITYWWGCFATVAMVWAIGFVVVPRELRMCVLLAILELNGKEKTRGF